MPNKSMSECWRLFPKLPTSNMLRPFLLNSRRDNDGALAAFKRELRTLRIMQWRGFKLLIEAQEQRNAEGISYAEEALQLSPVMPSHTTSWDAYSSMPAGSSVDKGTGISPASGSERAKYLFRLARAYTRANRKADADRARETFTRLNKKAEEFDKQGVLLTWR